MFFSVVVPCYNVEKYIEKCIFSILNQSYKEFELIIVNDGSTDNTKMIIESFKDDRIKIVNKNNGGLTSSRKAGLEIATGDYIVPIDGDDWVSPDYLLTFYNAIIDKHPDILSCGYIRAYENKNVSYPSASILNRYGYFNKDEMIEYLYSDLFSTVPFLASKVCRRELYYNYQMSLDNKINMGEDRAITYPMMLAANSYFVIEREMYYYRVNPSSLTCNKKRYISWDSAILKADRFSETLPLEKYNLYHQVSCYIIHSATNVIISHFKNDRYSNVVSEIKDVFSSERMKRYLIEARKSKRPKERLAATALSLRAYWLLKIWSLH